MSEKKDSDRQDSEDQPDLLSSDAALYKPPHPVVADLSGPFAGRVSHRDEMPLSQVGQPCIENGNMLLKTITEVRRATEIDDSEIRLSEVEEMAIEFRRAMIALRTGEDCPYWPRFEQVRRTILPPASEDDGSKYSKQFVEGKPLLDITRDMITAGHDSGHYFLMFLDTAVRIRDKLTKHMHKHVDAAGAYIRRGEQAQQHELNARRLFENNWNNPLRLPGVLNPETYNMVHASDFYGFSTLEGPNDYAEYLVSLKSQGLNLIDGKRILTFGPGNGRDEAYYLREGAHIIDTIEGSAFMVERLKELKQILDKEEHNGKFNCPDGPQDMYLAMAAMAEEKANYYDTMASCSVDHYVDDEHFLLSLMMKRHLLRNGGHLTFAIKAPGGTQFDQKDSGLYLINDYEIEGNDPATCVESVRLRYRMNLDAQLRAFRSKEHLEALLKSADMKVISIVEKKVAAYENNDQPPQVYYFVVCRKQES